MLRRKTLPYKNSYIKYYSIIQIINQQLLDRISGQARASSRLRMNYNFHDSAGQWHSLEVLEPDSVIFEVKEGPYTLLAVNDMLLQK